MWFGKGDVQRQKIAAVKDMEEVSNIGGKEFKTYKGKDLVDAVSRYFNNNFGGMVMRDGRKINLSRKGIKSSIHHNPSDRKNAAFTSVPYIITKGKEINYVENRKGNGLDSRVYAAPIRIGGNRYVGIVSVNEVPGGDGRFYLHHVIPERDL